jgi:hypothetical protein
LKSKESISSFRFVLLSSASCRHEVKETYLAYFEILRNKVKGLNLLIWKNRIIKRILSINCKGHCSCCEGMNLRAWVSVTNQIVRDLNSKGKGESVINMISSPFWMTKICWMISRRRLPLLKYTYTSFIRIAFFAK